MTIAAGAWACSAGRAFQHGNNAAMQLDWDLAVTYYAEAVKSDPERVDYKMALERAQLAAAQVHFEKARDFEKRDQLDTALIEYRRVVEFQPSSQEARAGIQRLEQTIRDRIEAARPVPPAEAMRQQARRQMEEPALNPASREPVVLKFQNRQMKEILDFLGNSTGINVAYDKDFQPTAPISVNIDGVTLEEALQQILTVNGAYYKVLNPRSILVITDSTAKRTLYDEQAVQTFYLSSADAGELESLLTKLITTQTTGVRPTFAANKNANSITVRGTVPMLQMVERVIAMNDKPRAEISVDVEILEVNRGNAKQYGLDLSSYQVGLAFSPEGRPDTETGTERVQSEHDLRRRQHGGLLRRGAVRGHPVPRAGLRDEGHRQAEPARRGRREALAQAGRGTARAVDDVLQPVRRRQRRDDAAHVVHVQERGREPRHRAARDLRRRHHPEGRPRDQREGPRSERGRPEPAVVLLAKGRDAAAGCGTANRTCWRASCGRTSAARSKASRASPTFRSCETCLRRTTGRSSRPTS